MNNLPSPEMVPGFQDALTAGLLPTVPANPPSPVTMNSTKVLLLCIAAVFVSGIAAIQIANAINAPNWLAALMLGVPVLAAMASFYLPAKARDKEYSAGYTYVDDAVMTYGNPIKRFLKVQNRAGPAGNQWNFRGLWKLNNNGTVSRMPVAGVLPIGYYPSPTRSGEFEYWTGAEWIGKYINRESIPQGGKLIP